MRSVDLPLAALLAAMVCSVAAMGAVPTITVPGEGTVSVPADQVMLSVSVSSTNNNSTLAASEAEEELQDILDVLKTLGLKDEELMSGFSTSLIQNAFTTKVCDQEGNNTTCKLVTKFTTLAMKEASIKIPAGDQDRIDNITQTVESYGGQAEISGYMLTDTTEARAKALKAAEEDANQRADALAQAFGGRTGNVVDISQASYPDPMFSFPFMMSTDLLMPFQSAGPAEEGMVEVSAYVVVTYELVQ